jgi:hypothetical protein
LAAPEIGTCDNLKRFPFTLSQKESEMAISSDKETQSGYGPSKSAAGENAPKWVIGGVAVLLVLGIAGYGLSGRSHAPAPDQPAIQHTTQPPASTAPPPEPTTTPKP